MTLAYLEPRLVRIIVAFAMLGLACAMDLKKREINDILWIGFAAVAVLLLFLNLDFWNNLKITLISMIVAPVALVLWRFGIFGGADALCLIVLAGLAPLSTVTSSQITPFTTLTNAAILSIVPLFTNLCRNIMSLMKGNDIFYGFEESGLKKILALFIGYKTQNPRHSFCIEQLIDGKRHFDFSIKHAEKTSFCFGSDVWVTPGLPYVIFITGGFVIQVLSGDVIFNLIHFVSH
jgi:preflagellin peptidase FlaK